MKLTITTILVCFILSSCGNLVEEHTIEVQMYGVSQAPESATGTTNPDFQNYRLLEVSLLNIDGTSLTSLFSNEDERVFRIVDRPQIIYSKAIEDLEGNTYAGVSLTFDSTVTGGDQENEDLSFILSQPTQVINHTFTIEKAQKVLLVTKLHWANTIAEDGMTEPSFEVLFE